MTQASKDQICALLKGIETGDPAAVAVVNEAKYIQHNPQTHEGSEGLAALFKRLSKTSPSVNIVRVFADGDYVYAHTEYDFGKPNVGFEVFRFEDGFAVEHWDNIQRRLGPNETGRTMVDGAIEAIDLDRTAANREIVRSFVNDVLIDGQTAQLNRFLDREQMIEHHPRIEDGLLARANANTQSDAKIRYDRMHRILAEGDFVLSVCEGTIDGAPSSLYDLYRVADGKLVEHWDTVEVIPPRAEWKNDNGKF